MLILLTIFIPEAAFAQIQINSAQLTLNDNDGNGVANVGDSIVISCIATNTLGSFPTVDLSAIGLSNNEPLAIVNGTTYSTVAQNLNFRPAPSITPNTTTALTSFTVSARWDSNVNGVIDILDAVSTQVTLGARPFDLIQVRANPVPAAASIVGNLLTVSITDACYQPGTTATVDLTPISAALPAAVVMTDGGGTFTLNYTLPANTDTNGPVTLNITLDDPIAVHPAVVYSTNQIQLDNAYPVIADASVTILSGNAIARPGDRLQLKVSVSNYDFDTASVTAPLLTNLAANPAIDNPYPMPLSQSNGPGLPAEWSLIVELRATNLSGVVPITFNVRDNSGNVVTRTIEITVDLLRPSIINASGTVYSEGVISPITDVATTTGFIRFWSELVLDSPPDNGTVVFVDLTPIGGASEFRLNQIVPDIASYQADFNIAQGSLEDGAKYSFTIYARDTAGNIVARTTTPAIGVDSNPPVVTGIQLTSANPQNSSIIKVDDEFTVQCNATGIENGSITVDLSSVGLSTFTTLLSVGGGVYRTPPQTLLDARLSPASPPRVDTFVSFRVSFNDTINSIHGADLIGHLYDDYYTNALTIDNEPPNIASTAIVTNGNPATFLIIGNSLNLLAQVASNPVTVTIDLTSLGLGNNENMMPSNIGGYPSAQGWYVYTVSGGLSEGILDRQNNVPFLVTATDDAGNTDTETIFVNIDNQPVKVTDFDLNVSYRNDPPDDTDISIINLNKIIDITVTLDPLTDEADVAITSATLDLSKFGLSNVATMTYTAGNRIFTYSLDNTIPYEYDSSSHRFAATVRDVSGNVTFTQSGMRKVDNWPPVFNANATPTATVVGGGSTAKVGDSILFTARVRNNENVVPTINLSNLGLSSAQAMTFTAVDGGFNRYEYTATIAAGNVNGTDTSWLITARDNDQNYATASTDPTIFIDSSAPQVATALTVSGNSQPGIIRSGEELTFTLRLDSDTTISSDSVTIDLRMIGINNASYPMINTEVTGAGSLWIASEVITLDSPTEYTNVRFTASILDDAGNSASSNSQLFTEIDCRPVILDDNLAGLVLWQDNGLVNPGFAGPGDVVMVWASATYYQDAVLYGNLASLTAGVEVDYATTTLTFNSANNRHEGTITIATHSATAWPVITEELLYRVRAVDNVNNVSTTTYTTGDFVVRNIMPTALTTGINLFPNYYLATTSTDILIYNLASSTTGDGLIASITFADNLIIHKAWLDFREFGTGTVDLKTENSSSAVTISGYTVNRLPPIEDGVSRRVWLYAIDQAGNATYTSERLFIDNIAPTLVSAEFDGNILSVALSENFDNDTFVVENWQIVGSSTLGAPASLTFNATAPNEILDWSSFQLELDISHLRTMAGWASTPIYLKVTNTATSAVTDMWGNELRPVEYFPITITDSAWREPARITHFTVEQNWPNSINIDLLFSKNMDLDSLAATAAVLLLASDTSGTFETNVDYNLGYVFQASSTAQASDTFVWQSPNHLRISLCETGRRWVAKKLTNNTSQKLYIACRNTLKPFVIDFLGKPVTHIDPSSPLAGLDNRPVSNFAFLGPPDDPKLSIGERSLVLSASDLLLLSNSPYNNNATPYLIEPVPTFNNRVTGFHGKIILHESNSGSTQVLQLEPLASTTNPLFASTTVTLKLNDDDLVNILALYKNNPSPIWEMTIQAGAFTNLWGNSNLAYLPSSYPGAMQVATGTPATSATLAAVSMSDKPPVSAKLAGELIFEVEVFPPDMDGIPLPLQWQTTPRAGIFLQDAGNTWVASGTFINYTERTVDGRLRGVFRYQNTAALPSNLQSVPAVVNIYGVTDIFGNTKDMTASYAYDLNSKNDGAVEGFTDTASAEVILDTQKPVVMVNSIIPNDYIGKIPAGSIFRVNFDEAMNQAVIPTLTLATSTETMTFTFSSWSASATAEFTNDSAFTSTLPNGTWYYQVSGGTDVAGNVMTTTGATAFPVEVRTYAPEVSAGDVVLRTVQPTISTDILIDQPWSQYIGGNAIFSVTYTTAPTQNFPHYLEIYDPISGVLQGSVPLSISGSLATATISAIAAANIGPKSYAVRIRDSLYNRTDNVLNIVYDGLPPAMTSFTIGGLGVGSTTAEYTYFNPLDGDLILNFAAVTTDTLRLAVYNGTATSAQLLNNSGTPGNYFLATGSTYADGPYTFTVVDLAGNIGTGSATRKVYADASAPVLLSIVPEYSAGQPGPYYIGKCLASETRLVVTFSEPMDADPAQEPNLVLTRNASTINWRFVGWVNPAVASTAIYENIGDITSALETGQYRFTMTGGRDLAFNTRTPASDQTKTIEVYTAGPYVNITNYTNQSHIYGTTPQANLGYNPFYTAPGSATIRIDFIGTTFDTYDLIVSSGATDVGSYTGLPLPTPSIIPFEPANASWSWAGGHPQDASYTLRVRDSGGDYSPSFGFRYDTATPTINTAIAMTSGPGIATNTEYAPAIALYHSPNVADTSIGITTINPDVLRLLALNINTNATYVADMTTGALSHSMQLSSLVDVSTGNVATLPDGAYLITGVDTAGNIADGTASTSLLIIDTDAPKLASAVAIIAGLPSTSTGVVATNTGIFQLTFDSGMNTGAASPTLTLASDSGTITMRATRWISSSTCEFTNTVAIDKSFTPGTYSYQISGARDYAGNPNIVPDLGSFTIVLFTEEPDLTAFQVVSNQTDLYGTQALINRPLSFEAFAAGPDIASLSLNYRTAGGHPYQEPHLIRIYDSSNNLASEAVVPGAVGGISTFTLNSSALGNPGAATESYSFRLIDNIGNISATYTLPIVYDGIQPVVATAAISTVSNAINNPLYYNEQLHGALNVRFETSASTATDSLVLVIATTTALPYTWNMYSNLTTGISTYSISVASAATIAEGHYLITAADMAGNFATGTASITMFVVDRTAPIVLVATTSTALPIVSATAGGATFTVQFNEHMNELSSATPTLVIATTTAQIACTFKGWTASGTAQFVNTATISNALPQGDYDCRVVAWDLTGNKLDTSNAGTMVVRSRGPIVASWTTTSYQSTTASATLASGLEMLTDQPFNLNYTPNMATITLQLSAPPDAEPIHLHFMLANTTIASYPLVLNGLIASFAWTSTNGPATATTYIIRVADDKGDLSLESHFWTMDNDDPLVRDIAIVGAETATDSVYFSPDRQRYFTTTFSLSNLETMAPRLRIRGTNSTDTYLLTSAGNDKWSCNFEGQYSRTPFDRMPDGAYKLDMVDAAGNVAGLASDGLTIVLDFDLIIDSLAPDVATYVMTQNGLTVTSFAPSAGDLNIIASSPTTPVDETNIWYIEVRDQLGTLVKRLPVDAGTASATWNGTDAVGNLVIDGYYTLTATDLAGNPAGISTTVFARTTPFRVMGMEQTASASARIWFNHDIDAGTLGGTPITATPTLAISGLARTQERALDFNVAAFTHAQSYDFTVAASIKSIFGAAVLSTASQATLVADARGPVIADVSFTGLAGQQEFRVEFDEACESVSAGTKTNYVVTAATGTYTVSKVVVAGDKRSVVVTVSPALTENADYTITASNIKDDLGNISSTSKAFKGQDRTPPTLIVSAFSNPANENDIIVVVTSNEPLKAAPDLSVSQSGAPSVVTATMQKGADNMSYMLGVSLNPSYNGNGTLSAEAQDIAENTGYGTNSFTVAYISSARASILKSADNRLALDFSEQSLNSDATVKILKHELEKSEATGGAIRTALQNQFRAAIGSLRGNLASETVLPNHSELVPVSDAYEIGILKAKVKDGFGVSLTSGEATSTTGIALFNQVGDSWNFVTASRDKEGAFAARTGSPQIFAVMRDIAAPRLNLAADMEMSEPFRTARPEFRGRVEEAGSGIDPRTVIARIDGGPGQPVQVDGNGNFLFKPIADLVAGDHDLVIKAADRTGNTGLMAATRFQIVLPLSISQIMQYPNPANRRMFIRISANRDDLTSDLVTVTIYDVAGHKVGSLDYIKAVKENVVAQRYLYDIPWDLRNSEGKQVANGVYFARIVIRDPDDPSIKTKRNFKLAVLR